ncbi:hypothetical protein F4556_001396 [Kitasatospora gansuensis]|uniref:Uncharacterized protein n=1 Tax=Kitasatospora gansuensis TaxID=258050 RepID=A0A7W7S8G2_9ACTN|nr:hypothetical protein [Kitasatospora gansuensis]MBB4945861.1 hypothetical protein [Kitasatospora gansuensis]
MSLPALFRGLFDDASVFPPGDLPLGEAVPAHTGHRLAWYAESVGPFLCGAGRAGELSALRPEFPVALVLAPGSSTYRPVPGLDVVGVEVAASALPELPDGVLGALELPYGEGLFKQLDQLAGTPHRAKFRTGGLTAGAFPTVAELAAALTACAELGVPYKCTAGLHNAIRHTDPVTGFEHHGFLNVLLAAADPARAAEALAERSGAVLAAAARELTEPQVAVARRSFTAFGTCSIAEPLADLAELGLLTRENR